MAAFVLAASSLKAAGATRFCTLRIQAVDCVRYLGLLTTGQSPSPPTEGQAAGIAPRMDTPGPILTDALSSTLFVRQRFRASARRPFCREFADWLKLAAWLVDNAIQTPGKRRFSWTGVWDAWLLEILSSQGFTRKNGLTCDEFNA